MGKSKNSIEKTLIDKISDVKLLTLTSDLCDGILDSSVDDLSALKEIPILGTIVNFYKSGIGIRDRIYLKKLAKFLTITNEISHDEKDKFLENLNKNAKEKERLSEKLFLLIDRLDDFAKSELIANSFIALAEFRITINEFYDLIYAIENLKLHYLDQFTDYLKLKVTNLDQESKDHFLICGLFMFDNKKSVRSAYQRFDSRYIPSGIGIKFVIHSCNIDIHEITKSFISKVLSMNISEIKGKFEHDIKELDYQQTELYLNKMNVEELLQSQFDEELNQLAFGKENMLRLRKVNNDLFHLIHLNAKRKNSL